MAALALPLELDPFDPNIVFADRPTDYHLYLHERDTDLRTVVDEIDYEWAIRFLWRLKKSSDRSRGKAQVPYVVTMLPRPVNPNRISTFLHKEICFRAYGPPPSPLHTIGDHEDGDTMNNRRGNLHWATPRMNRANRFGAYKQQLRMGV
jgi:hypothetical protein